jgi:hypothetical protein
MVMTNIYSEEAIELTVFFFCKRQRLLGPVLFGYKDSLQQEW